MEQSNNQDKINIGALLLLSLGHLITDVTQGGLPVLLPFIKESLHLSYAASGAILMTASLTSSIIQPIFGYFSDRWGTSWLLPLGVFMACLGFGMVGLASSYPMILLMVLLSGLGVASFHPEGYKAAQFFTGRNKVTGMSLFSVGGNAGFGLGPILAIGAYTWLGLRGTLLFSIPGFLTGGILLAALPWLSSRGSTKGSRATREEQPPPKAIGKRGVALTLLILSVTVRSWVQMGLVAFIPFYYVNVLQGDPVIVGKLLTILLIGGAVGTLIGAPIADRFGHKRFLVATMVLLLPLLWLFLRVEGFWLSVVLALVGGVLVSTFTVTIVMAQQILPDRLGIASGLMVGFAIGAGGIGATILGGVADVWGVLTVLRITTWLPILGFILAILIPYQDRFTRVPTKGR
jgi:MFS transporter, FSR family, fosmidomycin resistance protein